MKHDVSKTIKISNEHIVRINKITKKYDMNDSELVRLGIDIIHHFDEKNELLKVIQQVLEK